MRKKLSGTTQLTNVFRHRSRKWFNKIALHFMLLENIKPRRWNEPFSWRLVSTILMDGKKGFYDDYLIAVSF